MAFEVDTVYGAPDRSMLASDLNDRIVPMVQGAGASEVTGWSCLTGPMAGSVVMASRWDSLDAMAAWMAEAAPRMAAGGDLADLAARYPLMLRIISGDVAEGGTTSGAYLSAARFTVTAPPGGLDNAIKLNTDAGANGVRILNTIAAGELSGHLLGVAFMDSLDVIPAIQAASAADQQFQANLTAAGAVLQSRNIYQRI